ncbi:hypothetical protein BV22DRAFT_1090097 [Leucogyrophana mollusca]|uniref:Uncharacterized protein n=1 Tax=Leucogyrophana mollusca TaxID=85980 RepID=A0ACB8BG75_9AGAM|nr:hypothetical protein BV22DRAFT_1090097 [Leucogyrophana mollusca]
MSISQTDLGEGTSSSSSLSSHPSPDDNTDTSVDESYSSPSILPQDFKVPSCIDRGSVFFEVLTAPYRAPAPAPTWTPAPPRPGDREKCAAMVHWADTSSFDQEELTPATSAREELNPDLMLPIYRPHGRWAWADGLSVDTSKTLLSLRNGIMCSASIENGTIGGRELKFISRRWSTDKMTTWEGFHSELALYKSEQYLKQLQGDVVPYIIGVHVLPGAVAVTMEMPHPTFWMEASPTMPDILKERCIAAFEKIHARGVLHGDVELRHMLIGADGRVTIIDFQMSRATTADDSVDLRKASPSEFRLEMRKVKYKLDYQGARKKEEEKLKSCLKREARNKAMEAKRIRRANGERVGRVTPNENAPEEDLLDPPVHPQDFQEQWIEAADATPMRLVVPGQSEAEVAAEVRKFIISLDTIAVVRDSSGCEASPEDSAAHSPMLRKRKLSSPPLETSSLDTRSTKRARHIEDSPVPVEHHPLALAPSTGSAEAVAPPSPSTPLAPRAGPSSLREPPSPWTSPHTRVHMWYSDDPEDAEPSRPTKRPKPQKWTEIVNKNVGQCHDAGLPHTTLVKNGLIKPPPPFANGRPRRSVSFGNLLRMRKSMNAAVVEASRKREQYMGIKELKNAYIAACAGAPGVVAESLGVQMLPGDERWEKFLDMGEPKHVPEGPRILPTMEYNLLQQSRKQAVVRYSHAPHGILKRRRDDDPLIGLQPPDNTASPTIDVALKGPESHSLPSHLKGLPPPRKKVRTTQPRRNAPVSLTSRPFSKNIGLGRANMGDRATLTNVSDRKVTSLQAQLGRGPGVNLTPPSLRVLSSWLGALVPGWAC